MTRQHLCTQCRWVRSSTPGACRMCLSRDRELQYAAIARNATANGRTWSVYWS